MEELFELTMINVCDEINDSNIVNIISNIKTQHTECMKKVILQILPFYGTTGFK